MREWWSSATRASLTNNRHDKESLCRQVHSLCSTLYHKSKLVAEAEVAAFYSGPNISAGSEPFRDRKRQRSAPPRAETSDTQVQFRAIYESPMVLDGGWSGWTRSSQWVLHEAERVGGCGEDGGKRCNDKSGRWVYFYFGEGEGGDDVRDKRPMQTSVLVTKSPGATMRALHCDQTTTSPSNHHFQKRLCQFILCVCVCTVHKYEGYRGV